MTGRRTTRYPVQIEHAAPGKLVRTRTRHVETSATTTISGTDDTGDAKQAVPYLARTILPLASSFKPQTSYTIQAGDRIDNLAARLLGNPLLYWMLLEANNASDPATLCAVPGRKIIVPAVVGQSTDPFDQPQGSRRGTAAAPTDQTDDSEESA
ncbi:MAG TPA: baseplate wedge protein 53 [Sphingomonas sp.]|nr:baseplate wedge protein 53 [Sphingomonas sp.]